MRSCDVLIVGGGPAGSSCAWMLCKKGVDAVILDKAVFPRDKVCGGWITPQVLSELEILPDNYAEKRVLQPILGFLTGRLGGRPRLTRFDRPVSYGIRRCEFDEYLLCRSGAQVIAGTGLSSLERAGKDWIANGSIRTPLVIGAGGHFCPVARMLGARPGGEHAVAAQEIEFPLDVEQRGRCAVQPEIPELYFCGDLKGYGWCFRKGDYLNIGLGRLDHHLLPRHIAEFLGYLAAGCRVPPGVPSRWQGHAYLLYGTSVRTPVDDGVLLVGDAAGLAYAQSGEGIRPAVESGLLAAQVILSAGGHYGREHLAPYRDLLVRRFGREGSHWARMIASMAPDPLVKAAGGVLLSSARFSRDILLNRWFLHSHVPPLQGASGSAPGQQTVG